MSEQMTLGGLIDALKKCDPEAEARVDYGDFCPSSCMSYRGYYDQIAISYKSGTWPKVSVVLAELESALQGEFEGYKGGVYRMSKHTPVWVANYGESPGVAVVAVKDNGSTVVICTAHIDD